ncbi:putative aldehyde dehydrogenase AldA [Novipirellula aureliae]|uniref:Putative aldehyde dehydrogenase AldA n=1 Tax=Novipirellula aureliae TaxID=2527966 RepID=A0A5C6E8L4_9BACT|nr:aldehyde dehydrogenase family protein [Novipirellula aureliae]TWU44894.1 putative aldehyde dehydrogenase AldA [Novipirellula aureliae]
MTHTIEKHPSVAAFLDQPSIPAFIGGQWRELSGGTMDVKDPATGKTIAVVSTANANDVADAVESADEAFAGWSAMKPKERAELLNRLADKIAEQSEVLAQLEALDVGKPIVNARGFDVPFGADCLRYFADMSIDAVYDRPLNVEGMDARVHRAPYGVCGFIFPWNFPFTLCCWGIGPALAAGNTVVIKASEVTPLSTLYLGYLAKEVGIPDGVINIYTGTGPECGQPLVEHPLVRRISFTGSSAVGKMIGRICGERLIPCKLELGGKGAAVVLDDVDVDQVAEALAGAITLNTGQVCCTATRWFIHEKIYDPFVAKIQELLNKTAIGHGLEEGTQMGPLVSKAQVDRVEDYYKKGLSEGATAIVELKRPVVGGGEEGYFVSPHLLAGDDNNICFREEVFGPTAYLVKFKEDSDAIKRVNSLAYGLANSVWGRDLDRANAIAEQIVSGNSWINAHNVFAYGLPYGGVNLSGVGGGVNSPETFDDYLRDQTIARPLA